MQSCRGRARPHPASCGRGPARTFGREAPVVSQEGHRTIGSPEPVERLAVLVGVELAEMEAQEQEKLAPRVSDGIRRSRAEAMGDDEL